MELKKKYIGSKVFIGKLGREVEICEENKSTLLQHNQREFFITPEPKKVAPKKATPKKEAPKKEQGETKSPIKKAPTKKTTSKK